MDGLSKSKHINALYSYKRIRHLSVRQIMWRVNYEGKILEPVNAACCMMQQTAAAKCACAAAYSSSSSKKGSKQHTAPTRHKKTQTGSSQQKLSRTLVSHLTRPQLTRRRQLTTATTICTALMLFGVKVNEKMLKKWDFDLRSFKGFYFYFLCATSVRAINVYLLLGNKSHFSSSLLRIWIILIFSLSRCLLLWLNG